MLRFQIKMVPSKQKVIQNQELINKAIKEVADGTAKLREIAKKYGIPKSTLHYKMKNPGHKASFGPPPILTIEEEDILKKWITLLSKKGFPLKKEDLQSSVQKFLLDNPRPNSFKNNYPGAGWVRGFLKRHPSITTRTSEGVTQSSSCVSETDIRKWFSEIHRYLEENSLLEILNDSCRIFNGDESGFQLCPKTGKVLATRGSKNVYTVDSNNSKESITVMFTFSADGQTCPPMVVYNYQRIPQKVAESVPEGWGVGRSESGWMTSELFFEYIANIFHPYLMKKGVTMPIIYFVDGHKTHLTYEVSKLCKALNIELIALYPNVTRILQPADVAVFRPVKAAWRDSSRMWFNENPNEVITKANFAKVLEIALKKAIRPETLINGFKACGLFPFNADSVDYSKCLATNKQCVQESVEPLGTENIVTLPKFIDLVGPTKIQELRTCENIKERDENFQLLHKLYNTLDCSTVRFKESIQSPPIFKTIETQSVPATRDTDIHLVKDCREVTLNFKESELFSDLELDLTTGHAKKIIPTTTIAKINNVFNAADDETNVTLITPLESLGMGIHEMTPSKNPATCNENNDLNNSPAFKVKSNTQLGTYLTLPKTPEKKGKRNTVRMPFAVSSDIYRNMFKEQKVKKDKEVQKKEERKRLRQETKLKKNIEKREKIVKGIKKNTTKSNLTSTYTCTICSKAIKLKNRFTCDTCSAESQTD